MDEKQQIGKRRGVGVFQAERADVKTWATEDKTYLKIKLSISRVLETRKHWQEIRSAKAKPQRIF